MQKLIPGRLHGRAFGLLDAIDSWGFGAAIVAGGALAASLGGRATFALAGALALVVLVAATRAVRQRRPLHLHRQLDRLARSERSLTWAVSGRCAVR